MSYLPQRGEREIERERDREREKQSKYAGVSVTFWYESLKTDFVPSPAVRHVERPRERKSARARACAQERERARERESMGMCHDFGMRHSGLT